MQSTEKNNTTPQEASDKIFTIPNLISFCRLCMIPVCAYFMLSGQNVIACVLFALTAATDFVDGQVARRTNSVSKLGQLLDPAVDRILVIVGVICLLVLGRVPLWIPVFVLLRDALVLLGGSWLIKAKGIRIPVIYPGKVATTFIFTGMAGLILWMPIWQGLGWCTISWLPGFSADPYCAFIWLVYIGITISFFVTIYYVYAALRALHEKRGER